MQVPHFIIVIIPCINLLNLSWIIKCLFLRNMEPVSLSTLGKKFSWQHIEIRSFFFFPAEKKRFDISCKLSMLEIIAWNVKTCFLWFVENKKTVINVSSAELAKKVVKDKIRERPIMSMQYCFYGEIRKFSLSHQQILLLTSRLIW